MFFLILILLIIEFTNAHFICHSNNTDLCIGYSDVLKNGTNLQLKSRFVLQKKNGTERIHWNVINNENKIKSVFLDGGFFIQAESKRKSIGKVSQSFSSVGLVKRSRVSSVSYNKTYCLTVMECDARGRGFCDPYPRRAALKIKKGSYLSFLPCRYNGTLLALSQSFISNPPCAPGCFESSPCSKYCISSIYCSLIVQNAGCMNTTNAPTFKNTNTTTNVPTLISNPTYNPTTQPIISQSTNLPTNQPTIINTPTSEPAFTTTLPTLQPSTQPSAQPTRQPIIKTAIPTLEYRMVTSSPTMYFALTISQQVGIGVGVSLCLLILCTAFLCLFFKTEVNQFIIDQKIEREVRTIIRERDNNREPPLPEVENINTATV